MEGQTFDETDDECVIPSGFFEEDDSVWKTIGFVYGSTEIKNELKYTSEEVSLYRHK